ncbi:hypothetical protein [Nocardia sp. NPDC058497]|uniref:hypothetical protein n=1 Tax=Nocardia sp. NPDC058497 TaxID=3346529 RepID=UPI00365351F7
MSGTDPTYIGAMEHFESMPHEQIYARTQQIDAAAVLGASMAWLESAAALTTSLALTRSNAERVIEETGWEGAAADAAFASTRSFAAALDELAGVFGEVGARLGGVAAAAEAVKLAVVAPGGSGPIGTIARLLEAAHVIDAQMAAESLRQEAVLAMNMIYKPAYTLAGTGVPALPAPPGAAGQGSPAVQGGSRNGSAPTPQTAEQPAPPPLTTDQPAPTSEQPAPPRTEQPAPESPAPTSEQPAPQVPTPTSEQPVPQPETSAPQPAPATTEPAPQTPAPTSEQPAPQPEPSAPQPAPPSEQPAPSAPQPAPRAPEPAPQAPAPTSEQRAPEPPAPRAPEPHAADPAPPVPGGPVDPGGQPGVTGPIPGTNVPGPQPVTPPPAPPIDLDQPGVIPPRR